MSQVVLVTGANGFVGRGICHALASRGFQVIAASRQDAPADQAERFRRHPDLQDDQGDWGAVFRGVDAIVHVAGLAHGDVNDVRHDDINHRAVVRLVAAARLAGVDRFVFISSIAAQIGGSSTSTLTEDDPPKPGSAYGRAKLAAEAGVRGSGIRYTILRPPAIYGVNEKGNMALLQRLASLPVPLPFKSMTARRSMLSIDNLASAVATVLSNPAAVDQTFLVADELPYSLADLISRRRRELGRPPGLFPFPAGLIKFVSLALGKRALWERIGEPLVISSQRLRAIGWKPD